MTDQRILPGDPIVSIMAQRLGLTAQEVARRLQGNGDTRDRASIQQTYAGDPRLTKPIDPEAIYPNALVLQMLDVSANTLRRLRNESGIEPLRLPNGRQLIWTGKRLLQLLEYITCNQNESEDDG
jgi:hypothetical protein